MDILFISPTLDWKYDTEKKQSMRIESTLSNQESPHVGIAYLIAVAQKAGLTAKFIDMVNDEYSPEDIQNYVLEHKPTLVGFFAYTINIKAAGKIAQSIKDVRSITKICAGGPHVKALPIESLEEFPAFDFVVIGEGEEILPAIMENLDKEVQLRAIPGVILRGKTDLHFNQIVDYSNLPFPAWETFDLTKYPGAYPHRTNLELPMVTMRGCPYECTFCCRNLGRKPRYRTMDNIMTEIERNVRKFGASSIAFLDETFFIMKDWMELFCHELIQRGLNKKVKWGCSTRVSGTFPELFQMMGQAGCYYIFFGLESANPETLRRIKKGTTPQMMKNSILWAKQAGIIPVGAFIIGLESSTPQETLEAVELAKELELFSVTFPIAVPFPGSPLRDIALSGAHGLKILSNDWDAYGKQEPGVMETDAFPLTLRRELQAQAYDAHPKKKLEDYLVYLDKFKRA